MKEQKLIDFYKSRELSSSETESAVKAYRDYAGFLGQRGTTIEQASLEDVQTYIKNLQRVNANTNEVLIALARAHYLAGNNQVYIYFTQILERENIIKNLRTHIKAVIGEEKSVSLFNAIDVPLSGSPPDTAVPFTRSLVIELQDRLPKEMVVKALCGNAHGIPASAFAKEREYFLKSSSLAAYLTDSHKRSVDILDEHYRSGKVWFEQEISADTVEYVQEHREILGGVLKDGIIYWTKIPFKPAAWLKEEDPQKKRYLACHCPMAREALAVPDGCFPRVWCNCTAGYIKQRFNAIFDTETKVELLESVLSGDDRCRFAIHVPEGILGA